MQWKVTLQCQPGSVKLLCVCTSVYRTQHIFLANTVEKITEADSEGDKRTSSGSSILQKNNHPSIRTTWNTLSFWSLKERHRLSHSFKTARSIPTRSPGPSSARWWRETGRNDTKESWATSSSSRDCQVCRSRVLDLDTLQWSSLYFGIW